MRFITLKGITTILAGVFISASISSCKSHSEPQNEEVIVGAERVDEYIPLLKGKKVALFSNHTGMVGDKHTLDVLIDNGIDVVTIFAPEHGFRGTIEGGEHINSSVDEKTGVPISSAYNIKDNGEPDSLMSQIDVIISDIQDVGLRYYTYYVSMIGLMERAKRNGKEFMVLDRPNPNGMYVDGPVFDMNYKSDVGRLPIPTAHGMTLGELAQMANGEGWLEGGDQVKLTVIPCENYTHQTRYRLPINPSPNLRNMTAVYLYPSLCYFEATPVSLGHGTDFPFQVYGHPDMKGYDFSFTPVSDSISPHPRLEDQVCYGVSLREISDDDAIAQGVSFAYIIDAYNALGLGDDFFTKRFDYLAGNGEIRKMIEEGKTDAEIKATWAEDVKKFKEQRKPYLLYEE